MNCSSSSAVRSCESRKLLYLASSERRIAKYNEDDLLLGEHGNSGFLHFTMRLIQNTIYIMPVMFMNETFVPMLIEKVR